MLRRSAACMQLEGQLSKSLSCATSPVLCISAPRAGVPPTEVLEPELGPEVIAAAMEVAATQAREEREAAEQAGEEEEFATPPEVGPPGEEATPPNLAPPPARRGSPARVTAAAAAATPTASDQPSQVRRFMRGGGRGCCWSPWSEEAASQDSRSA